MLQLIVLIILTIEIFILLVTFHYNHLVYIILKCYRTNILVFECTPLVSKEWIVYNKKYDLTFVLANGHRLEKAINSAIKHHIDTRTYKYDWMNKEYKLILNKTL